jgi:DNA-binding NtrC family response regulator
MTDHVVVAEDDRELRHLLAEVLTEAGYAVTAVASAEAAVEHLEHGAPADLAITDLVMPGMGGEALVTALRRLRPEINVIVITAFGSIDSAIQLVKAGAYDYVTKPFGTDELMLAMQRALDESRLRREVASLRRGGVAIPGFVGASRVVRELAEVVARAARSRHPVLITGESGSGKEIVARAIHQGSGRREFVAVNCGAIPDQLLESELFGHEKGAFSGADRAREGLLEAAHGGTVFLDEIGEMPLALQPKILRALEHGEVRRVGATESRRLEFRLIAATHRNLEEIMHQGGFREDLYWRLAVLHVHVPPLRDRASDIPLLAEHFLELARADQAAGGPRRIAPDTMALLTAYPWPGNVRELRNAIQRAATLAGGDEILPADLPPRIHDAGQAAGVVVSPNRRPLTIRELERAYILEVLRQVEGNKSRAAELLGLDRKTLYRKLTEYRLEGVAEGD